MDDPFYSVDHIIEDSSGQGMIIGKNGSLTYVIRLDVPEAYSLYKDDLENRHRCFNQAFSHMPDNSYIHKQDVFKLNAYQPVEIATSYLAKADFNHFKGREYLTHSCVIGFTLAAISSLSEAYTKNPFSYKDNLIKNDRERLGEFLNAVEYAINNLSNLPNTKISFLLIEELKEYLFSSANFYDAKGVKDIHFEGEITSGKIKSRMYAVTSEEYLPDGDLPVYEKDQTISKDKSELYMSFAEAIAGIHLPYNHTYNQIFYFYSDKKLKGHLQKNINDCISNRGWDAALNKKAEDLKLLYEDISKENATLCYAHFSVLLWDENLERLDKAEKQLRSSFDIHNVNYYIPSYGNLAVIYGAGIIGCTSSLPLCYMFLTSLPLALTFSVNYTIFRNDPEGLLFNDRLFQIPLRKDIWDSKKKRIKARNAVVIAPTGGGKSFTTNNIVHQLLDQGYTVVAVEFGNSFKQLCFLYPETSIHIEYDQNTPLGINPFDLEGEKLNPDKEEFLLTLCLRFWQQPPTNANQTVALRKFIKHYYREIKSGHSFQGLYSFLINNFERLCKENEIINTYFDIESFKLICSEFMEGGNYANLCATTGIAGNLKDKRFIHFELTKVKNSPFVSSVVMSLLFDVINNKILSDPSKKGYIIFDEYAETAQMKSVNSLDVDIHQTVAFFYQKIRKENGAVMTIIQSPVQLPNNEYTKGIIANTQLLYVLEGTEVVYDAIIETFKIKNPAHINQMKSIQNNYSCQHPYSECWIRFGENYALTVRIEASKRKYLAFQTEGETRSELDKLYSSNGDNMQEAIEQLINK